MKNESIRIMFMGSPVFAIPTLDALNRNYGVIGVITQPDRPAGRGKKENQSAIKQQAISLGLEIYQPQNLRDKQAVNQIENWKPNLIVVCAFGQILTQDILDVPKYGCLNIHASLLPRWRGASPIQAAILNGDRKTGISIMKMDAGLDTGPILVQKEIQIFPDDNAQTLSEKLSALGADLLIEILPLYFEGQLTLIEQNNAQKTIAALVKKEDGKLNFLQTAEELERRIKAYNPWPGAYFQWRDKSLKVLKAHIIKSKVPEPNHRYVIEKYPGIGTSSNILILDVVQPAGKKPMQGNEFLNGARDWLV